MSTGDKDEIREKEYINELRSNEKFANYNNYWRVISDKIKKINSFDACEITYDLECSCATGAIVNGRYVDFGQSNDIKQECKNIFSQSRKYMGDKLLEYDAIVELGSGWGRNLFHYLSTYDLSNVDIYSGEYTESGMEAQKYLKDKFFCKANMSIFHFDYNDSDLFFQRLNKKYNKILYLTFWSIEQITYLNDKLFYNMLCSAENVSCIHVEPVGWQITAVSIMKENITGNRKYYNKNLYKKLSDLVKLNKIRISNISLDYFNLGSAAESCGTLIEWHKT